MKLYKVTLKGMTHTTTGVSNGISFAVAESLDEAYAKVKKYVDEKDLGFSRDRELATIELVADSVDHNNVGIMLHL